MYKIAICDDDIEFMSGLERFVKDYCTRNHILVKIDTFSESGGMLDTVESRKYYDLYILDIEMPGYNGMYIAKRIKETLPQTLIILVTVHMEFAIDGYILDVFRYIPKNCLNARLENALRDAFQRLQMQEGKFYIISNSRRFEKIDYNDICYIYKKQKNTMIVTERAEEIPVRKTLNNVYEELDGEEFIYIDRCYIINMLKIKRIENERVYLSCGKSLTMSVLNSAKVKKKVSLFWGERI